MRLPRLAIENHQFTNIFIILLVISGTVSFFTMPRSEDPQVAPAASSIVIIYPGANPTDMEELVIDPLEEALNELEDIKEMSSTAEDGLGIITIKFLTGSDPDKKYADVLQKVNSTRHELPQEILSLETTKWTVTDVQILQVALVSESAEYRTLEKEAKQLKKSFERSPGVKRVTIWAYPQQEVRVSLDMEKIAQYRIPLSQIFNAIQSTNQNIPGGKIDLGEKTFNIETSGSFASVTEIENTIIHAANGNVVHLKDVADVRLTYQDLTYKARLNGKRAVFITLSQKKGTNIFSIKKELVKRIDQFSRQLPPAVKLVTVFDQSESVAARLNRFFSNLLQGLVLVGAVVLLAVGFRASMIVLLAIPISIMIGIGFTDLTGYGLQQMTIAGLVIALGLLVDNAIVVIENISRFIKMGYDAKEAAVRGTNQIAWAVVSSTATTVLAFVPMMLMQNITGDFIRSMPLTVVYTLTASLFISLTLTPYLSSKFIRIKTTTTNPIRKFLDRFIETKYRSSLDFALVHPKLVITIALVVFTGSLCLFPLIGVSFFPKAEKPQFVININTPKGTNLDKTDKVVRYVESVLAKRDEIKNFAANIGHGNPRIYYNVIPAKTRSTNAQIFVELKKNSKLNAAFIDELRKTFADYPGAKIKVKEFEQGPPVEAPIVIRVLGENLDVLKRIARDVEEIVNSVQGTINVINPLSTTKADLHLKIDRDKAGMLGVPLAEIDRTVRTALAGWPISKYRDAEGKEYNIVVRLPVKNKLRIADLDKIYVSSLTGAQIPLKQVASLEFKSTPLIIDHYNMERYAMVTADVYGKTSVDQVMQKVIKKLNRYQWPKGYRYAVGGELEAREESFGGMAKAIIIAVIGIFAVLVLQFRSYSQPFIVFSAIPLALIGSLVALFITGYHFSFTAFVGLTSLVGIVVNNSIILVDYTNQLRRDGKPLIPALKEAGEARFMPIILTTLTTVGGLLPLTLIGGTLFAPMGWTIIGGLLASTFLTLIIVPVLYKLFTRPHIA